MSYSLILLENRLVSLAVLVCTCCVATFVKEELGLVEVLLLSCNKVKLSKSHLSDLVARYAYYLVCAVTDLAAYAVSVSDGDVKEVALSCSLVVCDCTLYHVTEVVELMAEVLYKLPTLCTSPLVRMLRVHCTACVEVSVRLLSCLHDNENAVDVSLKLLVRISLEKVACTLDSLVNVSVVECKTAYLIRVAWVGCLYEVLVTTCLLTLAESERNCCLTACLEALAPECISNLY